MDYGGGDFFWDSNCPLPDDGAITVASTGTTVGRWRRFVDGKIDIRWFGAVGDAENNPNPTDNWAAITAALAACSDAPPGTAVGYPSGQGWTSWRGLELHIPFGRFFLSQPLRINHSVRIRGIRGQTHPASVLMFPPGPGLIPETTTGWADSFFSQNNPPTDGGTADEVHIQDLAVWGTVFYGLHYMDWQPNHAYTQAQIGLIVTSQHFVDFGYAFKLHTAGTSGATEPIWPTTLPPSGSGPPYLIQDGPLEGGCVWEVVSAHGIQLVEGMVCERVYVANFPGNGFHLIGAATPTTPAGNLYKLINCKVGGCGGSGLWTLGNDASAGGTDYFDSQGNGGYGMYVRSFLGDLHSRSHIAGNGAGSVFGNDSFVGLYIEGSQAPAVVGSVLSPDTIGAGPGSTPFTRFPTITWRAGMTLEGPTWVLPTQKLPGFVAGGGFCFYATSGTTGQQEPPWGGPTGGLFRPYVTVQDNTVNWLGVGDSRQCGGLIQSNNQQGPTLTPHSIDSVYTPLRTRLYLGEIGNSHDNVLGFAAPDRDGDIGWMLHYRDDVKGWEWQYAGQVGVMRYCGYGSAEGAEKMNFSPVQIAFPTGIRIGGQYPDRLQETFYLSSCTGIPRFGKWQRGYQVFHEGAQPGEPAGWTCIRAGQAARIWYAGQPYSGTVFVKPSVDNGHCYVALNTGYSGASEPVWPTAAGATVQDGDPQTGILWQEAGALAGFASWGALGALQI